MKFSPCSARISQSSWSDSALPRLLFSATFARDQASDGSDVDILVRFTGPATSRSYFGVQFYIEDLLGRRVDLVTDKALRPQFRPFVEQEALDV